MEQRLQHQVSTASRFASHSLLGHVGVFPTTVVLYLNHLSSEAVISIINFVSVTTP